MTRNGTRMQIAIPLYTDVTYLDAIGPYEVLRQFPNSEVVFVAAETGLKHSDNGDLSIMVNTTFDEVREPDVVVVPGGFGTRSVIAEDSHPIVNWVREVHPTTRFTASVCTGSLILAKAGLLADKAATTHWGALDLLAELGARPTSERVVEHIEDRIITAAGVSSGIDMALRLAELLDDDLTAKAMQLMIEYDPQPPFDAGSVTKAGDDVMARLVQMRSASSS